MQLSMHTWFRYFMSRSFPRSFLEIKDLKFLTSVTPGHPSYVSPQGNLFI